MSTLTEICLSLPGGVIILAVIGAIVVIIVLINTAGNVGWYSGYWWYANWKTVAVVIVFLIAIGIIVGASQPQSSRTSKSPLAEALRGTK